MVKSEQLPSKEYLGPQEKCGITAVLSKKNQLVTPLIPRYQFELHHRGRDSSGIATFDHASGTIQVYKGEGSTGKVFNMKHAPEKVGPPSMDFDFSFHNLISDVGIGQNRYGTSGDENKDSLDGAQPMHVEWEGKAIAVAFNGNIPLSERRKLQQRIPEGLPRGMFDTNDIAQAIVSAPGETWEERIANGMHGVRGSYSLTILADDGDIYGIRGPDGAWPLWMGESDDKVVLSSESIVDRSLSWSEVQAGELVHVSRDSIKRKQIYEPREARCFVHAVYGAHPDSLMSGDMRYRDFRIQIGERLALEQPVEADVYTYVPNSGRDIALGYTRALGVELTEVFKIGQGADRSYITKNIETAEKVVDKKFDFVEGVLPLISGKRIATIDETTIKGTTARKINSMLHGAGAVEVHNLNGSPVFVDDCENGMVIRKDQHVAVEVHDDGASRVRESDEIAGLTNADSVSFLSRDGAQEVGKDLNFCMKCMGGEHPFHANAPVLLFKSDGSIVDISDEVATIGVAD